MTVAIIDARERQYVVIAQGTDLIAPLVDRAETAVSEAETAAASAIASAARLSPFINPPPAESALSRIGQPRFFSEVNGIPVVLPNFTLMIEAASDSLKRGRFRFAGYDGTSVYTEFAIENNAGGVNIDTTGLNGVVNIPLYSTGGFSGLPNNTQIGYVPVDFGDGSPFGTYFSLKYDFSEGGIRQDLTRPDEITDAAIDVRAVAAMTARGNVFTETVTDAYLRRFITKAGIEGGDPAPRYIVNYETGWFPGVPLARIRLFLYDTVLGVNVAQRTVSGVAQADCLDSFGDKLYLCNAALGSILSNYKGIGCQLWIDKTAIDWSKTSLTTYTDYAEAGIKPEYIAPPHVLRNWGDQQTPHRTITFGNADADFPTLLEAVQSTYISDLVGSYTRTTFPISDECSFFNQVEFVNIEGPSYVEEVEQQTISGVAQSKIVTPPFSIIRLNGGMLKLSTGSILGSVIERPWQSAIYGGVISNELEGSSYCSHEDIGNALARVSTVAGDPDTTIRFPHLIIDHDVVYQANDNCATNALRGCGTANEGQTRSFGVQYLRNGNTPNWDMYFAHTSPDTVSPGLIEHTNCTANDGDYGSGCAAVSVLKSDAMTVRHKVIVNNCDFERIEDGNTAGGSSGYERSGRISTAVAPPTSLDP